MLEPVRVLVVDDSPFVCALVSRFLACEETLVVAGTALSGEAALEAVRQLQPDVVTLDLEMPGWGGLETVRRIMGECPTPIVVVSGLSGRAAETTLRAIEGGAVDFIFKYTPRVATRPDIFRRELAGKVRNAARIRVVRTVRSPEQPVPAIMRRPAGSPARRGSVGHVVVVGASTGGPVAVRELLGELPVEFGWAVIVVQHMPAEFTGVLATQLGRWSALPVKEAEHGDELRAGQVFVAPGGSDLLLGPDGSVHLVPVSADVAHAPSINRTLLSAVEAYGCRVCGVLLTGMGEDGAEGLLAVRRASGRAFAQELANCVVPGMPARAAERGAVERLASPYDLGRMLADLAAESGRKGSEHGDHDLAGRTVGSRAASA